MSVSEMTIFDVFLQKSGLKEPSEEAIYKPLTGGVSSDIYRVELPGRALCVKRALPKLKVATDWQAPVSRNEYEWNWISFVAKHFPSAVPKPLAHDPSSGVFAMEFLPGDEYPLWKAELLQGHVDLKAAEIIGRRIGQIHSVSARMPGLPEQFDSTRNFYALRLEPYLVATAAKHPFISDRLSELVDRTANTRHALVHGDVSPKNILLSKIGPVFLDAECAWFGDPAFDLAFCLNHLLLKKLIVENAAPELAASFEALTSAYLNEVDWEDREAVEARTSSLLPALFLARVDGKSPVEYVTEESQRMLVRKVAVPLIASPRRKLAEIAQAWFS
ncbi:MULTISPECIES: aminoglycoside phosphotransferase family protein [unclassified Rhizobium]|uniref:phosphotransferase family protein n=1 Tax=unclassified Rhizobium TaxID=2613769 RepID=UPI000CDF5233|nr:MULTISPECIES: aminoglycoside phosphotransferase family protein [Rhizobium]AVA26476.1 aminoglycoside phosphotransferase protein [Rhizobium sp. NXC24]UWU24119.1 aminoglycoside phosphotransferase family protein [Rhizobium tropici]